jgi:hypothetical protein
MVAQQTERELRRLFKLEQDADLANQLSDSGSDLWSEEVGS